MVDECTNMILTDIEDYLTTICKLTAMCFSFNLQFHLPLLLSIIFTGLATIVGWIRSFPRIAMETFLFV